MGLTRRQVIQSFGASGIVTSLARTAHAQVESARILTGFPPGGTSDATCRRVAEKLNGTYAKSVVVENRTGAAGQIAITAMKSVAADGLVMLQTPMSMLGIYPHIYKKLPYDPVADLTPVVAARQLRLRLRHRPVGAILREDDERLPCLVQGQPKPKPTSRRRQLGRRRISSVCCSAGPLASR